MLAAGVCDETERQKCEFEFGPGLAWACENCPKSQDMDISEYTAKLLRLCDQPGTH